MAKKTRLGLDGYGVRRTISFANKIPSSVSGTLSATDNIDTALFNGNVSVSGTLSATDAVDTALFNGSFTETLGAVYLDPAKLGSNIVLSNLNLTATQNAATVGNARANVRRVSGKYYCEFTVGVAGDMQVGLCNGGLPLTETLGFSSANSIGVDDTGNWLGAAGTTTAPALIVGHTYGLATEIDSLASVAGKAWCKDLTTGGAWNASSGADPATGVNGAIYFSPPAAYSAAAQAFFARLVTQPPTVVKQAYDAFFTATGVAAALAKLDIFNLYNTVDEATAKTNLISASYPTDNTALLPFTVNEGFIAIATQALKVPYPRALSVKFTQNNASYFAWTTNAGPATGPLALYDDAQKNSIFPRFTDDRLYGYINSSDYATDPGVAITGAGGMYGMSRNGTSVSAYQNGVNVYTRTNTSATFGTNDFAIQHNLYPGICYGFAVGGTLTDADVLALHNAVEAFKTAATSFSTIVYAWGDSLTYGNNDGTGVSYPSVLSSLLGTPVSNQGAGGETSGQILTRFEAYPSGYDDPVILAMGRNDYTPTATPNIATAVSHLTTTHYLIHSILPAAFDPPATVSGIASVNANLASVYGTRFVDCLAALQAANDGSPGDLADIAAGYSPRSLRFDGLHLNSAGYTVVANALYAKRALLGF